MKKIFLTSLLLLTFLFTTQAQAKVLSLIFLYPGGQGSQEEAQPVLDDFAAAIKKVSKNQLSVQVKYFSDSQEGINFIKSQKPAGGILSRDFFEAKGESLKATPVLQTLQLPSGDGTQQFFVLSDQKTLPESGTLTLLSSRPLEAGFLKQKLFPKVKNPIQIKTTENLVGNLRKIGSGKQSGYVLLSDFENKNIQLLKSDWVKNLQIAAKSEQVPSAPFVIFSGNISEEESKLLQEILKKLGKVSSAKETLELLRLKGFR